MKKSLKVKKLIDQNGIEIENFTMVLRLKKIIQELNVKIQQQNQTIMELKRDTKTTKINQMEVQIQHLNDQNKRLTLMIQEIKNKYKKQIANGYLKFNGTGSLLSSKQSQGQQFVRTLQSGGKSRQRKKKSQNKKDSTNGSLFGSGFNYASQLITPSSTHKKSYPQAQKQKQQQMKQHMKQKKFEKKYYELLEQTQKLKKQLINIKINEPSSGKKQRKSCTSIDKNSLFLQKNMQNMQKITQKKHDLQVQNQILKTKVCFYEKKIKQTITQNEMIKKMIQELKVQLKCKTLLNSDKTLATNKSGILKDLSNISTSIGGTQSININNNNKMAQSIC